MSYNAAHIKTYCCDFATTGIQEAQDLGLDIDAIAALHGTYARGKNKGKIKGGIRIEVAEQGGWVFANSLAGGLQMVDDHVQVRYSDKGNKGYICSKGKVIAWSLYHKVWSNEFHSYVVKYSDSTTSYTLFPQQESRPEIELALGF
jgi:hypothetical protein